jgi:hypothetical protein
VTKLRAVLLLILAIACGGDPNAPQVSKEPVSVRGWIVDVSGAPKAALTTPETESVRRMQLFQATNVWIDDAPYVSGGVAENGTFLLLDVPPGNITISFSAPGAPNAKLVLKNIPGNADVFVPSMLLKSDGVALLDPQAVRVRLAASVDKPTPTSLTASIAGLAVPVVNTPIAQMVDRHDYPPLPAGLRPLATFK